MNPHISQVPFVTTFYLPDYYSAYVTKVTTKSLPEFVIIYPPTSYFVLTAFVTG